MSGEFWLGLRYIYVVTEVLSEISFEFVIRDTGLNASAVYNNFTIENEKNFFRMHVGNQAVYNKVLSPYITRQNGFFYHNNMKFTTRDTVDPNVSSCAKYYRGGYWFNDCIIFGNLNGQMNKMFIKSFNNVYISGTKIKVRRMS